MATSGVYISVDRDGWTRGLQLSVDIEGVGGYRLAGPKFNGSSASLKRHQLSARDCDEIERAVKIARENLAKTEVARARHYVKAITVGGRVKGYGVYDDAEGIEVEHVRFVKPDYEPDISLHLANNWRDDANAKNGA